MALDPDFFLAVAGVGTPKPSDNKSSTGPVLPPASSVPPAGVPLPTSTPSLELPAEICCPSSAHVDELWLVKDARQPGGNPTQGPRDYDAPRTPHDALVRGDFERYQPEPGSTFKKLYEANRAEWKPEGCGELDGDDGMTCAP